MDEERILEKLDEIHVRVELMIENAKDDGMIYMLGSQILAKLDEIKELISSD